MKSRSKQFNQNTQSTLKGQVFTANIGTGKIPKQELNLIMWNVNGIRSVLSKNKMNGLIEKYKPDFICINETKINGEYYLKEKNKLKIMGFHDYWNFCKCSAGYSGVAVYTKYAPKSIFNDIEQLKYSQEGRVLTLEYQYFYLIVVYMPSAGDKSLQRLEYKTMEYEVAFQKYCKKIKQKALQENKNVILCGDFNTAHEQIDFHQTKWSHKQPSCTPEERASFKKIIKQGWIDTFRYLNPGKRAYTWWRIELHHRAHDIGRRLDYFLVNKQFISCVRKSQVCKQIQGSDHCPIFMKVNIKPQVQKTEEKEKQVQVKNIAEEIQRDCKKEQDNQKQYEKTEANEKEIEQLQKTEITTENKDNDQGQVAQTKN